MIDPMTPAGEMIFRRDRLIRFSDCDPAGIVFYPQYFVMFNGLVEDWVNEGLGVGYQKLVIDRRVGLPTVSLQARLRRVQQDGRHRHAVAVGGTPGWQLADTCPELRWRRWSAHEVQAGAGDHLARNAPCDRDTG